MTANWYVVRAKPQCDALAESALARGGFETFIPWVQSPIAQSRRSHVSLFPGYIFLKCGGDEGELPSISHLPGIVGWVRFNGVAPSIPEDEVKALARRVEQVNQEGGLWQRFRAGQAVHVQSGKLEGLARVIEEPKSPQARVRVLLEFMGRLVPAQVPAEHLRPAPELAHSLERARPPRRTRGRGRWIGQFKPSVAPSV
ncbi:MAG: hypothetical protein L0177_00100 [Chloroflexi bacterium]|nr:hypothetical protein [Chloroflexota bacterium]